MRIVLKADKLVVGDRGNVKFQETTEPVIVQPCKFAKFGCLYQGLPDELTMHCAQEKNHHLSLTLESYDLLADKNIEHEEELSSFRLKYKNAVCRSEQLQERLDLRSSQVKLKHTRIQNLEVEVNVKTDELLLLTDDIKKLTIQNEIYLQNEKVLSKKISDLEEQLNKSMKQNAEMRIEIGNWFSQLGVAVFTQDETIQGLSTRWNGQEVEAIRLMKNNNLPGWRNVDGTKRLMVQNGGWLWNVVTQNQQRQQQILGNVQMHSMKAQNFISVNDVSKYQNWHKAQLLKVLNENEKLKSDIIYFECSLVSLKEENERLNLHLAAARDELQKNTSSFPTEILTKDTVETSVQTVESPSYTAEKYSQTEEFYRSIPSSCTAETLLQTEDSLNNKSVPCNIVNQSSKTVAFVDKSVSCKVVSKTSQIEKFDKIVSEKSVVDFDKIPVNACIKSVLSYTIREIHGLLSKTDEYNVYSFLTEEFYTGKPGYKLQFRIVLFQNRLGFDFRIKKGVFDKHLQWPFKGVIKLSMNMNTCDYNERGGVSSLDASLLDLVYTQMPMPEKPNAAYPNKDYVDFSEYIDDRDELQFDLIVE